MGTVQKTGACLVEYLWHPCWYWQRTQTNLWWCSSEGVGICAAWKHLFPQLKGKLEKSSFPFPAGNSRAGCCAGGGVMPHGSCQGRGWHHPHSGRGQRSRHSTSVAGKQAGGRKVSLWDYCYSRRCLKSTISPQAWQGGNLWAIDPRVAQAALDSAASPTGTAHAGGAVRPDSTQPSPPQWPERYTVLAMTALDVQVFCFFLFNHVSP